MKVLVVIVNYKVTDLTLDCLASLPPEVASVPGSHVALVENGTSPADAQRLADAIHRNHWSDWVTLTSLPINLGFTGGNNAAIRPALASDNPPQYVHLLNADTIVRPGALKALVDFMDQNPTVGIAGSRLEDPDGTPQVSASASRTSSTNSSPTPAGGPSRSSSETSASACPSPPPTPKSPGSPAPR